MQVGISQVEKRSYALCASQIGDRVLNGKLNSGDLPSRICTPNHRNCCRTMSDATTCKHLGQRTTNTLPRESPQPAMIRCFEADTGKEKTMGHEVAMKSAKADGDTEGDSEEDQGDEPVASSAAGAAANVMRKRSRGTGGRGPRSAEATERRRRQRNERARLARVYRYYGSNAVPPGYLTIATPPHPQTTCQISPRMVLSVSTLPPRHPTTPINRCPGARSSYEIPIRTVNQDVKTNSSTEYGTAGAQQVDRLEHVHALGLGACCTTVTERSPSLFSSTPF